MFGGLRNAIGIFAIWRGGEFFVVAILSSLSLIRIENNERESSPHSKRQT